MNHAAVKTCLLLSAIAAGIAPAAPGYAQSRPDRTLIDITLLQGERRNQALLEGARKEGELNIYLSQPAAAEVARAFAKKYGINAKMWRSSSENVLQRVVTEARAGRFEVDITQSSAPEMEALHREKLLVQAGSPYLKDLMPQAVPAHREWVGIAINRFVQAYNTEKIRKEDLPGTYQDLLHPKWKGRLGIEAADQHWFAYVLQELGQDKGIKLFKDIVATNGMSVRKGHSLLAQLVASGEVPLALTLYSWGPDKLKQKGAPIERFDISQPIAQFICVALLMKAPHPHAAVLFYDFMLTEGQAILSREQAIATSGKFDVAQKQIPMRFIDPAAVLDNNEKWLQTFDEIFAKNRAK